MDEISPAETAAMEEFARGVIDFDALSLRIPNIDHMARARNVLLSHLEDKKALTSAERAKIDRLRAAKAQMRALTEAQAGKGVQQVRDLQSQIVALTEQIARQEYAAGEMLAALASHPSPLIQAQLPGWRQLFHQGGHS